MSRGAAATRPGGSSLGWGAACGRRLALERGPPALVKPDMLPSLAPDDPQIRGPHVTVKIRRLRLAASLIALTVLVAVVIGVAWATASAGPEDSELAGAAPTTSSDVPSTGPSATVPADGPPTIPTSSPGSGDTPPVGPEMPVTTPDAGQGSPPEPATEIPPADDGAEAPLDTTTLPPSTPRPALFTGPTPDSATAQNKIVDGFPAAIPVAARSTVSTSDISVENDRVRASLTATTPQAGADVLAEYDAALASFGFTPADAPAVGGSTAREYRRGAESVTVTVTPSVTGGSGYTLLALLVASE